MIRSLVSTAAAAAAVSSSRRSNRASKQLSFFSPFQSAASDVASRICMGAYEKICHFEGAFLGEGAKRKLLGCLLAKYITFFHNHYKYKPVHKYIQLATHTYTKLKSIGQCRAQRETRTESKGHGRA